MFHMVCLSVKSPPPPFIFFIADEVQVWYPKFKEKAHWWFERPGLFVQAFGKVLSSFRKEFSSSQNNEFPHLGQRRFSVLVWFTASASLLSFQVFMSEYLYIPKTVHGWDSSFGKPGLSNVTGVEHQEIYATLEEVWMKSGRFESCTGMNESCTGMYIVHWPMLMSHALVWMCHSLV